MKLITFIILFVSSLSFGQINITWSDYLKDFSGNILKVIPNSENSFYTVTATSNTTKDVRVTFFQNGKVQNENSLSPGKGTINSFNDAYIVGGQLYLFYSSETTTSNRLFAQRIDQNCQLIGAPILLNEQNINAKLNSKSFRYFINVAPNEKYLSLTYLFDNENVLKFPYLKTIIYDRNLGVLREEKMEAPYYLSETALEEISMTNQGTTLILLSGFKRPSKAKTEFNSLDLYRFNYKSGMRHDVLETTTHAFFNPIIQKEDSSSFVIAYQYNTFARNRKPFSGSKGVMFYEYYPFKDSLSERMQLEFDKKQLLENLSPKDKKLYDKYQIKGKEFNLSLQSYKLRNLILLKDSSRILTMEEYWIQQQSYQQDRMFTTYVIYNFNNLMVMKFDPQFVRDYSVAIPKVQISRDDSGFYSSFFQYLGKDKHLYLLFNDNLSNYSETGEYNAGNNPQNFTQNAKRYCTTLVDFDLSTGKYNRRPLLDRNDVETLFVPRLYNEDDLYHNIILTFNRSTRFQFGMMKF